MRQVEIESYNFTFHYLAPLGWIAVNDIWAYATVYASPISIKNARTILSRTVGEHRVCIGATQVWPFMVLDRATEFGLRINKPIRAAVLI